VVLLELMEILLWIFGYFATYEDRTNLLMREIFAVYYNIFQAGCFSGFFHKLSMLAVSG